MYFGCNTRTNTFLWVVLCFFGMSGIIVLGIGVFISRDNKSFCEQNKICEDQGFGNCSRDCDEFNPVLWIGVVLLVVAAIPLPIMCFCVDEKTKSCLDNGVGLRARKVVRYPNGQVAIIEEDVKIEPYQGSGFGAQQTSSYGTQVPIDAQQTTIGGNMQTTPYATYPPLYTGTPV